jgi:hypothetical protein
MRFCYFATHILGLSSCKPNSGTDRVFAVWHCYPGFLSPSAPWISLCLLQFPESSRYISQIQYGFVQDDRWTFQIALVCIANRKRPRTLLSLLHHLGCGSHDRYKPNVPENFFFSSSGSSSSYRRPVASFLAQIISHNSIHLTASSSLS